jgi:modulator of FtsH protease HflC
MTKTVSTLLVAAILLVIILFMMCAYQVRYTEMAVLTHWDKITNVVMPQDAGLHFKWPWPIDRVHIYDARLRTFDSEFRQLGTKDQRTVVLTAYATWRVADPQLFMTSLDREDAARRTIGDMLESSVSNVLKLYELEQLVNVNAQKMKFNEIENEFLKNVRDNARTMYGVDVVKVGIKRLNIPESVTKEVFARMKEDRQRTIKQLAAEGQAESRKIRAEADEISKKIQARAEAYAKTVEGQGDAEAAKYYRVFAENRKLSDFLKKLESVRKIFDAGQMTLVMDAGKFMPFDMLQQVGAVITTATTQPAEKADSLSDAKAPPQAAANPSPTDKKE